MARKIRDSRLESRTARLRLPIRKKPYTGPALARGVHLLYRRNKGNGTWVVKAANGHGGYWTKGFKEADDFEDCDGIRVLTFYQACDEARALARGKLGATGDKPMTVADALTAYKRDLKSRGGHLTNATRVEKHLTSTLAGKPVGLLTVRDLQSWRDGLIEKMEPSSVNRTRTGLRAALELAAFDPGASRLKACNNDGPHRAADCDGHAEAARPGTARIEKNNSVTDRR
jgi:hypothetical protein